MAKETSTKDDKDSATLRDEAAALLAQARSKLVEAQMSLALTSDNPELRAMLAAEVGNLQTVVHQLSLALSSSTFTLRGGDLAALQSAVQAGAGTTTTASTTLVASDRDKAEAVSASAAYTRQETQSLEHDVFDKHEFDPYLRFSSPADEAAFRHREAATKQYIDAQLARKTPEGDLNAGGAMQGELLDAHAHGAGASPDFLPNWNALNQSVQRQHDAMRAAGQSTAEYDRNLTASVTSYLKTKGLSDAEIKARLAASAHLLDAVKPYINDDHERQTLEHQLQPATKAASTAKATPISTASEDVDISAISARLKAAGVTVSATSGADPAHGLAIGKAPSTNSPAVGG